ncbi:MAG: hypothetical protein M1815_001732 [Lichina confinis]|nr:MAG: hypothetical protein M1815_001732 [Lichina confinis]
MKHVDNPLRYQTRAEARTNAKHFHERHELGKVVDEDVFIRAALVAMDPDAYMEVEGLTEIERRALDEEQSNSFWQNMKSLTKEFRVLLLTCCLAAVVQ